MKPPPPPPSVPADPTAYTYRRLSSGHIRLLKFPKDPKDPEAPYHLYAYDMGKIRKYATLSYTWDSPIITLESEVEYRGEYCKLNLETRDGLRQLKITKSLFNAITALRTHEPHLYLWADGICINQEDNAEKESQIPLMGKIYSQCEFTIAWLGPESPDSKDFVWVHQQLVPKLTEYAEKYEERWLQEAECTLSKLVEKHGMNIPLEKWFNYLKFLSERRWFSRAWVVQEVALSPSTVILCGSDLVSWQDIVLVNAFVAPRIRPELASMADKRPKKVGPELNSLIALRVLCDVTGEDQFPMSDFAKSTFSRRTGSTDAVQSSYALFETALQCVRASKATKPQDKVYSVLGILVRFLDKELDLLLTPNYDLSLQEVFTRVAWILIRELPCFSTLSICGDLARRELKDLPSWVPDLTVPIVCSNILELIESTTPDASGASEGPQTYRERDGNHLFVDHASADVVTDFADNVPLDSLENPGNNPALVLLKYIRSLFRLLLRTKLAYSDEKPCEILWKTLINGLTKFTTGQPITTRVFWDWLMFCLGLCDSTTRQGDVFRELMDALETFRENGDTAVPTPRRIVSLDRAVDSGGFNGKNLITDDNFSLFDILHGWCRYDRRIFVTEKGYIGNGPVSLKKGDKVCLIHGAKVIYILRPTEEENAFILIGDAYLHGCMHGELIQNGVVKDWTRISVV